MIPIKQTITGKGGNCLSACLASILHMDIKKVPNFNDGAETDDQFWNNVRSWLRREGWGCLTIYISKEWPASNLEGYQIVCGQSERGLTHATVWKDGVMIHDPHPDNTGLIEPECADLLYPIDASKMFYCDD